MSLKSEDFNACLDPCEIVEGATCGQCKLQLVKHMDECTDKKPRSKFSTKKRHNVAKYIELMRL